MIGEVVFNGRNPRVYFSRADWGWRSPLIDISPTTSMGIAQLNYIIVYYSNDGRLYAYWDSSLSKPVHCVIS